MQLEKIEHIFREYDIRGLADTEITEEFVFFLGHVLAVLYKKHGHGRILLAFDTRKNSRLYHDILAKVFSLHGLHCISLGCVPTPCLYFAVHSLKIFAGVTVTASHNPAEYNGFKIWNNNTTLSGEEIKELYRGMAKALEEFHGKDALLSALGQNGRQGFVGCFDVAPSYTESVLKDIKPFSCRVVIDGANGTAGRLCTEIFRKNGADAIPLFCEFEEDFPNHGPDPTKAANLGKLLEKMKESNAEYGIALDGDGDRVVLADKKLRILKSDELMSIFVRQICREKEKPLFLLDVKCSQELTKEMESLGADYLFMPTGHSLLKRGMLEKNADFGGEFSGHFFHSKNWYKTDDGILTALRAIAFLEENKLDLTGLPEWRPVVSGEEMGIACTKEQKKTLNRKLAAHFSEKYKNQAEFVTVDGIRCIFPDAWFLVRCSNTSEQLTLRFEADSESRFLTLREEVLKDIGTLLKQKEIL